MEITRNKLSNLYNLVNHFSWSSQLVCSGWNEFSNFFIDKSNIHNIEGCNGLKLIFSIILVYRMFRILLAPAPLLILPFWHISVLIFLFSMLIFSRMLWFKFSSSQNRPILQTPAHPSFQVMGGWATPAIVGKPTLASFVKVLSGCRYGKVRFKHHFHHFSALG